MIYIKRIHMVTALLLILGILLLVIALTERSQMVNQSMITSGNTVVIDAGHGGKDAGTIGVDGTEEKGINLQMAQKLYDFLTCSGIRCSLIRDGDYEYYPTNSDRSRSDLYNRLDYVNSVDSAVLISVHQNHYDNESEWGTQIWYSANDEQSKVLADNVLCTVKEFLQPGNTRENKASDDSYYLLYRAKVPSIMVECGFMSNQRENELLQDSQYQADFAYCILLGICEEV